MWPWNDARVIPLKRTVYIWGAWLGLLMARKCLHLPNWWVPRIRKDGKIQWNTTSTSLHFDWFCMLLLSLHDSGTARVLHWVGDHVKTSAACFHDACKPGRMWSWWTAAEPADNHPLALNNMNSTLQCDWKHWLQRTLFTLLPPRWWQRTRVAEKPAAKGEKRRK